MKWIGIFLCLISCVFGSIPPTKENNFWFEVEALCWQAWGKGVVVTNAYEPVITTNLFTQAPACHPDFPWDVGFRLSAGTYFLPPHWTIGLSWLNWRTSLTQNNTTNTNDGIDINMQGSFPIWDLSGNVIPQDYINNSSLQWRLLLNVVDLTLQRVWPCKWFISAPFAGLRFGSCHQGFDVQYAGGLFQTSFISPGNNLLVPVNIHMKNNYWGLGPRVGFAPEFILYPGLRIVLSGAISGLLGQFHLNQSGTYLGVESFNIASQPFGLRWVLDAAGGIAYTFPIFQNRYDVTFKASYEFHEFYHQLELKRDSYQVAPHDSNLRTQGVTVDARMDF